VENAREKVREGKEADEGKGGAGEGAGRKPLKRSKAVALTCSASSVYFSSWLRLCNFGCKECACRERKKESKQERERRERDYVH
jgi:hypothetical protein